MVCLHLCVQEVLESRILKWLKLNQFRDSQKKSIRNLSVFNHTQISQWTKRKILYKYICTTRKSFLQLVFYLTNTLFVVNMTIFPMSVCIFLFLSIGHVASYPLVSMHDRWMNNEHGLKDLHSQHSLDNENTYQLFNMRNEKAAFSSPFIYYVHKRLIDFWETILFYFLYLVPNRCIDKEHFNNKFQ